MIHIGMVPTIHHLACISMCPRGPRVNERGILGIHVVAVETARDGLILVDTGYGTAAVDCPKLIPWALRVLGKPQWSHQATAVGRLRKLGLNPKDVRHIVVTHLDSDHAGGLRDFPNATVHVHERELNAATQPSSFKERNRYLNYQLKDVAFSTYSETGGHWFGFSAVTSLKGIDAEIALIPLFGHSRGHCGVAIRSANGWLLHAGDAYFHHSDIRADSKPGTKTLNLFQKLIATNNRERLANRDRLREVLRSNPTEVNIFCAHDPLELEQLSQSGTNRMT